MKRKTDITTSFKSDSTPTQVRLNSDYAPTMLRLLSNISRTYYGGITVMKRSWMLVIVALMATFTGCVDETVSKQYTLNATMERLQNADTYGSKVQLVNEEWTYWEHSDSIDIISNASVNNTAGKLYTGWLVNGGGGDYADYDGVFITTLEEQQNKSSQWFIGVHPANYLKHEIKYSESGNHGFTAKVFLENVQHYRHDSSYARQVLPMIAAYDGAVWDENNPNPYRLDFHALAGLVRLQLVNATGSNVNIKKIELESLEPTGSGTDTVSKKALAGLFRVKNLYNFNAHLDYTGVTNPQYTLTLSTSDAADEGSLEFKVNDIKSFYVVLPAFHGMDTTTVYHLQMRVYTTGDDVCTKNFTVQTRRNGITYMRAISISEFNTTTGAGTPVLVGNGTSTRPFKIYTLADLLYVRERFLTANLVDGFAYVNGQKVTKNTWFRVMRSDIVLRDDVWTSGIENFRGHFTYFTNAPRTTHGITNRSVHPLFQSITNEGYVNDLTVISDTLINITPNSITNTDYSPLCYNNNGQITDCRVISPSSLASNLRRFIGKGTTHSCYAGICVNNNNGATVTNCVCYVVRDLEGSSDFAGICKQNNGTINGCATTSPLAVSGAVWAGGICLNNNSLIANCYSDFHYTSGSTDWGGIVYQNNETGSCIVRNCYFSPNGIIRGTGNIGGIACINRGFIDYCRAERGSLRGSTVGGIAATVSAGELRNCYVNDSSMVVYMYNARPAVHYGGGLVGHLEDGNITNCFALVNHVDIAASDNTGLIGTVVGYISGGTIKNCYGLSTSAAAPTFYGGKESSGVTLTNCYLVGAEQSGVGHIYAENEHANSGEDVLNDLTELLTKLNAREGLSTETYTGWQRNTSAYDLNKAAPYLVNPYSSAKGRR